MSEEDIFKRSEVGHDANDLHRHGGLDAHDEEKTERENLEDAIEALKDSEEGDDLEDIESEMKAEAIEDKPEDEIIEPKVEEPVEAPVKEEPKNDWKSKEENQPYMTVDEVREPKKEKKGGAGWKVATFLFLILAIAGCGAAAYLFLADGTTKFLGREVTSRVEGTQAPTTPTTPETPEKPVEVPVAAQFDFEANTLDYANFVKIFNAKKQEATPLKVDITKDGKYYYVIADVAELNAIGGYAGVWYRETKSGATWTELQSGQVLGSCKNYTQDQLTFMQAYDYIDDDLDSKYVGCAEN